MKEKKFPRFLLASNFRIEPVQEYIICTRPPHFIAEITKIDLKKKISKGNLKVEILEFWDSPDMEPHRLEGLKKRMIDWYIAQKTKP